jgi:hypothetical protein
MFLPRIMTSPSSPILTSTPGCGLPTEPNRNSPGSGRFTVALVEVSVMP